MMESITIQSAIQNTEEGTTLQLCVRDCPVLAIFPIEKNIAVYQRIRHTLLESCLTNLYEEKTAEIGQNMYNMR